jgi:hypothetical protein
MTAEITREAIQALAQQQGVSELDLINKLQAAAAALNDDESTLDRLCEIKLQVIEGLGGGL